MELLKSSPPALSGVDQTPEKIRRMFGAITPSYDRLNHLLSGQLDKRWRAAAARTALAELSSARHVLDVATGTGDLANELRATHKKLNGSAAPLHVTGADFTRPMLRRAQEKYGHNGFRWLEADGTQLPFATETFDAVTVAFGLRNMIDKPAALSEMARVARRGGRVVILEFGQPRNILFRVGYDFYSFQVLPRIGKLISGSDAYVYLARSIRSFYTADGLKAAMQASGLMKVQCRALLGGVVYLHWGDKPA